VRAAVAGLTPAQLDTPYKKWTVRQIVHHLADSHVNAYMRFKSALTEDMPTIKPYDETKCAELPDSKVGDIGPALALLDAVHAKWVVVLKAMSDADFARVYVHPEYQKEFALGEALGQPKAWLRAEEQDALALGGRVEFAGLEGMEQGLQGFGRIHFPVHRGQGHAAEPQRTDRQTVAEQDFCCIHGVSIRCFLAPTPVRSGVFQRSRPVACRERAAATASRPA
jgi:hypothetical protein